MTKKEAEDYRYGYQHIGIVDNKEVSIRKASNCGGWIDLNTNEVHSNESLMEITNINKKSISNVFSKLIKVNIPN